MKFELKPNNRDLTDEELLDDLRSVAQQLGKSYVTKEEYNKNGRLCASTFQNRFDTWCNAHDLAGLERIRNYQPTAEDRLKRIRNCQATTEDCIEDIRRVAAVLKTDYLITTDYKTHGRFSLDLIGRRVGPWKVAIAKAGLTCSPQYHETATNEELFENLEQLWETLGRQPTRDDLVKPISRYSRGPYRRFGSYRKALEAFVGSLDKKSNEPKEDSEEFSLPAPQSAPTVHPRKTSRNVSWRTRFLVMRRANFRCQICGISPAVKPGTVLVIDHIEPWASGGETVMDNLQTLCEQCNGGKSNLPLHQADGAGVSQNTYE